MQAKEDKKMRTNIDRQIEVARVALMGAERVERVNYIDFFSKYAVFGYRVYFRGGFHSECFENERYYPIFLEALKLEGLI